MKNCKIGLACAQFYETKLPRVRGIQNMNYQWDVAT